MYLPDSDQEENVNVLVIENDQQSASTFSLLEGPQRREDNFEFTPVKRRVKNNIFELLDLYKQIHPVHKGKS